MTARSDAASGQRTSPRPMSAANALPADALVLTHPLYALAEQTSAVESACHRGLRAVVVLHAPGQRWICAAEGGGPCFHCFHLWRLHGWTVGFTRDAVDSAALPPMSPVCEAWVEAGVAAAVDAAFARIRTHAQGDVGEVWRIGVEQRTVERHTFLRHPDCPRCPPLADNAAASAAAMFEEPSSRTAFGTRSAALADLASEVLPGAVDPRTGLIRRVVHRTSTPLLSMRAAALYPFRDPTVVEQGFGRSGRGREDGIVAALEAIERFAGMRPRGQRTVVRGSYRELRAQALDPAQCILHPSEARASPAFALAAYCPDTVYEWVWGYSFRRGGAVLVPLQLAYFGLGRSERVLGGRFVYEISNGCALGASMVEAALHGLLEVIERDAFLASWYARRALDAVDVSGCRDPFVQAMLARLQAESLETVVYDIRCDLPPAAFAVSVIDRERRFGPSLLYAAGAHLDRDSALRAALSEAVTFVYRYSPEERAAKLRDGERLLDTPEAVRTMADHALQCWPERALSEKMFVRSDAAPAPWSALPSLTDADAVPTSELLDALAASTLAVAHDVIVIDQSFEPFRARGLRCVKVLAPGLLPMTFGHQHRRICRDRLAQVSGRPMDDGRLFRDDPHVFP
jgi:ribosomal protein S12 methylthiotransferase accessory factor